MTLSYFTMQDLYRGEQSGEEHFLFLCEENKSIELGKFEDKCKQHGIRALDISKANTKLSAIMERHISESVAVLRQVILWILSRKLGIFSTAKFCHTL